MTIGANYDPPSWQTYQQDQAFVSIREGINLRCRFTIIPIVDLAARLRMKSRATTERSAIVVTEIGDAVIGLLVERVSDMLTVSIDDIRPVPPMGSGVDTRFAEGIVSIESGMICFLDLEAILGQDDMQEWGSAIEELIAA